MRPKLHSAIMIRVPPRASARWKGAVSRLTRSRGCRSLTRKLRSAPEASVHSTRIVSLMDAAKRAPKVPGLKKAKNASRPAIAVARSRDLALAEIALHGFFGNGRCDG